MCEIKTEREARLSGRKSDVAKYVKGGTTNVSTIDNTALLVTIFRLQIKRPGGVVKHLEWREMKHEAKALILLLMHAAGTNFELPLTDDGYKIKSGAVCIYSQLCQSTRSHFNCFKDPATV